MHYLSEYQTFENKQQLNESIYQHIKRNSYELNDTDRATLKAIARYAVKFAGAVHLKAATIAELIGKSEKTARRVIAKLAGLGILRKVPTTRKVNGGKGANIIQILPFVQSSVSNREQAVKLTESKVGAAKSENEPSDSIKHLKNKTSLDTASVVDEALKDSLPSEIYTAMSRYFKAESIYKYYGILLRAKRSINRDIIIENDPEPFVSAWHNAILKAKQGKLRNLDNYLYRAWQSATGVASRRLKPMYDWLNK